MVAMNYAKLKGRIAEKGTTQKALAVATGMTETTFSLKMNNRYEFTANEIRAMARALDIAGDEIGAYFFTPKV